MHLHIQGEKYSGLWRYHSRYTVDAGSWRRLWRYVSPVYNGELPRPLLTATYSALIAAAVYLLGGIAYQRTVMHQRGWRQLPNYAIWAGIGSFCYVRCLPPVKNTFLDHSLCVCVCADFLFKDILIILTSSCSRFLPHRKGYNQLPTSSRNGRGSRSEQENRLIDQLDEEWDD